MPKGVYPRNEIHLGILAEARELVKHGPLSEETKRKIGDSHRGRPKSEMHKKKISDTLTGRKLSKDVRKRMSLSRQREKSCLWRGGIYHHHGYIMIYKKSHPFATKHGYVMEHRLVMEKHLGRYLKPTEIVHHIDGNTENNKLENLLFFPKSSSHARFYRMLQLKGKLLKKWKVKK